MARLGLLIVTLFGLATGAHGQAQQEPASDAGAGAAKPTVQDVVGFIDKSLDRFFDDKPDLQPMPLVRSDRQK